MSSHYQIDKAQGRPAPSSGVCGGVQVFNPGAPGGCPHRGLNSSGIPTFSRILPYSGDSGDSGEASPLLTDGGGLLNPANHDRYTASGSYRNNSPLRNASSLTHLRFDSGALMGPAPLEAPQRAPSHASGALPAPLTAPQQAPEDTMPTAATRPAIGADAPPTILDLVRQIDRSEERRVGKECRL